MSGSASAAHWSRVPNTRVYGLSRRSAALPEGVNPISVDLLDPSDVQRKLGPIGGVTQIVFAAYIEKPTAAEKSKVNVAFRCRSLSTWPTRNRSGSGSSPNIICSRSLTGRSLRGSSETSSSIVSSTTSPALSRRAAPAFTNASIRKKCSTSSSQCFARKASSHSPIYSCARPERARAIRRLMFVGTTGGSSGVRG